MNWKDETCQDCRFRVNAGCRRFPPQNGMFPQVVQIGPRGAEEFNYACAEYKKVFIANVNIKPEEGCVF